MIHIVSLFFVLSGPNAQRIGTIERKVRGDPRPYVQDGRGRAKPWSYHQIHPGKTVGSPTLLSVRHRGSPSVAHIPGSPLGANAQREDMASTGISNPGCRQDSSALRQACLAPLGTGDPEES